MKMSKRDLITFYRTVSGGLKWGTLARVLNILSSQGKGNESKLAGKMLLALQGGQDPYKSLPEEAQVLLRAYESQAKLSEGFALLADNTEKAEHAKSAAIAALFLPSIAMIATFAQLGVAHWLTGPAIAKLGVRTWQMDFLLNLAAMVYDYWPIKAAAFGLIVIGTITYIQTSSSKLRGKIDHLATSKAMVLLCVPTLGMIALFTLAKLWRDASSIMSLSALMAGGQPIHEGFRKIANSAKGMQRFEFENAARRLPAVATSPAKALSFLNERSFHEIMTITMISGDFSKSIEGIGNDAMARFEKEAKRLSGVFSIMAYAMAICMILLSMNANFSIAGAFTAGR